MDYDLGGGGQNSWIALMQKEAEQAAIARAQEEAKLQEAQKFASMQSKQDAAAQEELYRNSTKNNPNGQPILPQGEIPMQAAMPQQISGGNSPLEQQYIKALIDAQGLQKEGIGSLQERIAKLQSAPPRQDGIQQAIIAAADIWGGGGGKFNQMYQEANPELDPKQRQAAINQLEETLRKSKGDLSDSQIQTLKAKLGFEEARLKAGAKANETPDIKEWQFRAGEFASRAGGGDQALDDLFQKGYTPSTGGGWLPDAWMPEDRKAYENYAQTFINSVLRRESGASISDPEAQKAMRQYIPVPGDSKTRIAEKSLLRKQAVANMGTTAGPAMQLMQGINLQGAKTAGTGQGPWQKYGSK